MIKQPPSLKKGDKIAIVCPAKKLPKSVDWAIKCLESWGLEVILGESFKGDFHQFAGTDELRTADLQRFLDDATVKAIFAARGGYGTIRIIDNLDFKYFQENPKWIIGFSDITVLLSHLWSAFGIKSIHGQMPYTFEESSIEALLGLKRTLFGESINVSYTSSFQNRPGVCEGTLIGGNLTLLLAVEGSVSAMDFDDTILFIEDVGEHEYAVDRMLRTLKRKGKLARLKGLIVGAFNGVDPEPIPFGQSFDQVVQDIVSEYSYPVCYNFPSGHIEDNRTMVVGAKIKLSIQENDVNLVYL
ncbi:MAG: LD-carboxypeptidase [Pedobacter sp.]|nr:MAG: LD-carboxypeptidase [Pedobacter sp.]